MSLADHSSFERPEDGAEGAHIPLPPSREQAAMSAEKRRAALMLLHRHLTEFPDNPTGWRRTINLSYVEACEVLSAYVQTAETADLRRSALALLQSMDISCPTPPASPKAAPPPSAVPGMRIPPALERRKKGPLPEDVQFRIYASMRFLLDKAVIAPDLAYRLAQCMPPQWGRYEGKFQGGTRAEIDPSVYEAGQEHLARTIGWTVETTKEQLIALASSLEPMMKKSAHVPGKPSKKEFREREMRRKCVEYVAMALLCEVCGWSEERACALFGVVLLQYRRNRQVFSGKENKKGWRRKAVLLLREKLPPQERKQVRRRLRTFERKRKNLTFDPTNEPAGSKAKLDVLAERARNGMPLWHPEDREDMEGMIAPIPPQNEGVGIRNDRGDSPVEEEPEEGDAGNS